MFERPHNKTERARELADTIPGVVVASDWVFPQDYQTEEVESRRLPALKGATPTEWPTLERTE